MATRGTVVLLGKRGTGKSTIANVIYGGEDELRRTESHRLFTVRSSTTSLWCAITILKPPGDDATYHITVIDTPGFFDTNSKISNKKIIEDLRKYFIENIPDGVSLVIFVMRKNRFTQEDQDVFDFLRESLSEQIGGISALLITHCDCECASERKRFLETFKSGKESGKVAKFMGKGVYTVGFPDLSTTRETLIPMLKEDIEVVRKLVYESSGAFILAKEMFIEKNRKWFLGNVAKRPKELQAQQPKYDLKELTSSYQQLEKRSPSLENSLSQLQKDTNTELREIKNASKLQIARVEASLNQLEQTTGSTLNEIRNDCKESNARVKASLKQKNEALQQSLSEAREEVHQLAVSLELSKKDNHNIHTNLSEKLEKLIESKNEVERQWSERFSQAERRWTEQFTMAERSWKEQLEHLEPSWSIDPSQLTVTDEELGKGAYGEVKVGLYCGGQVAVKQLHQIIISPYFSKQFNREMQLASRLRHPQLVLFIGAVTTDKVTLLVTELMETSLRKQLMQSRISKEHILPISRDVACALNYLHSLPEPIIHRDVSSANVLLNSKSGGGWMAKLGDLGSANFLAKLSTQAPGAVIYAAPESLDPALQGPSMDVYSFGVLLFEVCTGELPDPGQREALRSRVPFGTNQVITVVAKDCTCSEAGYRPTMAAVLPRL